MEGICKGGITGFGIDHESKKLEVTTGSEWSRVKVGTFLGGPHTRSTRNSSNIDQISSNYSVSFQ